MRTALVSALSAALTATIWLTHLSMSNRLVWDHFDVVKHGVLYRSGQLETDQLEAAVRRYGIRTIVNFQVVGADVERERALAQRLGTDFVHLPMPGNGAGREDQFRAMLSLCNDPRRRPVLAHCARGTCRTGAAVALYRFERDGWTVEDVAAEMRRQSYRDGWLPGYVFQMVKERPFDECFEPSIRRDCNLSRVAGRDDRLRPQ